jgi:lipopolysaccharide transport system ATP-binding protein
MSNTAIKVESLSKIYRLGEIGTGTISRDLERWFKTKVLKQEDPFLKIGETNDRANKGASDIVYSLQDINFEINQGDAVGIIGRNGAGKSTLLKILSRVTTPTTGKINIKGRVASLLEVGTGFHPELTGRENIYLNGAILGMRKREIDRKLDEIIDFSGVERYIDTPVKRYSSGMYVRLAFAVAAHLESEILIVDEVLAVGDAEFQKKCLGKMGEVSKGEGRTVLFVSHNMTSILNLCPISLLLKNGSVKEFEKTPIVVDSYNKYPIEVSNRDFVQNSVIKDINLEYLNPVINTLVSGWSLKLNFQIENYNFEEIGLDVIISHAGTNTKILFLSSSYFSELKIEKGQKKVTLETEPINFAVGHYVINVKANLPNKLWIEEYSEFINFEIPYQIQSVRSFELLATRDLGFIIPNQKWKIE